MRQDDGGQGGRRDGAGRPRGAPTAPAALRQRLIAARLLRTQAQARKAALEVAVREGRLVDAALAERDARRRGMAMRDAALSVPGRVAATLAAAATPAEAEHLLRLALLAEVTRLTDSVV